MRPVANFRSRLARMSRDELIAGVGVALVASGLAVRFAGHFVALPLLAALRALPDDIAVLFVRGFGLLEIAVGIAALAYVGARHRNRADDDDRPGRIERSERLDSDVKRS